MTSMDLCEDHSVLVSGYENGFISIFDVSKSSLIKLVTDLHTSSLISVRLVKCISNSEAVIVSVDQSGFIYRIQIKRSIWGTNVESSCLLDGSAGCISAISVLQCHDLELSLQNKELIAFNSSSRTYVVQMYPQVEIVYRWMMNDKVTTDASMVTPNCETCLQYLDYEYCRSKSPTTPKAIYLLRAVRLVAEILRFEVPKTLALNNFDTFASASYDDPIEACYWLKENICIFFSTSMIVTNDKFVSLSKIDFEKTYFPTSKLIPLMPELNSASNKQIVEATKEFVSLSTAPSFRSFGNCMSSSSDAIYILSCDQMTIFEVVPPSLQIEKLIEEGFWLQALAIALKFSCDKSLITCFEHRKYILQYCKESLKNACSSQTSDVYENKPQYLFSLQTTSQPTMIAEVCIEFCTGTSIMDTLFTELFDCFISYNVQPAFIQAVESAILSGSMKVVPDNILKALIDHSIANSRMSTLENCIICMTLDAMDITALSTILFATGCFSGYLYASTFGIHSKVEEAFVHLFEKTLTSESDLKAIIMDKLLLHYLFIIESKRFPNGDYFELDMEVVFNVYIYIVRSESKFSSVSSKTSNIPLVLLNFIDHDSQSIMFCLRKAFDSFASKSTTNNVHALTSLFTVISSNSSRDASTYTTNVTMVPFFSSFIDVLLEPQYCCYELPEFLDVTFAFLSSFQPKTKADYFSRRIASNVSILQQPLIKKTFDLCKLYNFWRACNILVCHLQDQLSEIKSYFRVALLSYTSIEIKKTEYQMQVFEFIEEIGLLFFDDDSQLPYPSIILDSISSLIIELIKINKEKVIYLSTFFAKADSQQILNLLSQFPQDEFFKYEFLKTWFISREATLVMDKELKSFPSDAVFLIYFELLSKYCPSDCIGVLNRYSWRPCRDRINEVATNQTLYQVTVFILDQENDAIAALDILFKEFFSSIQKLTFDKGSDVHDTRYSSFSRPPDSVLTSICSICVSNTSKHDGSIWFTTLTRFLLIKESIPLLNPDILEIVDKSVRLLIAFMLRHLRPSEIAKNLTLKSSSPENSEELFGMCSLFLSVMTSLRVDYEFSVLLNSIYRRDMLANLSKKFSLTVYYV